VVLGEMMDCIAASQSAVLVGASDSAYCWRPRYSGCLRSAFRPCFAPQRNSAVWSSRRIYMWAPWPTYRRWNRRYQASVKTEMTKSKHIHLIGICGTAMASLAGMLKQRGIHVTGSDAAAYPPMSTFLAELGIFLSQPFAEVNLKPRPDLVVVGNAISRGNVELEAVLDQRIPFASLPQVSARRVSPGQRRSSLWRARTEKRRPRRCWRGYSSPLGWSLHF
jgi:hypothetical protein